MGGLVGLSSSADNDNSGIGTVAKSEKAFFRSRTVGGVRGDSGLRSRLVGDKDLKQKITAGWLETYQMRRETKSPSICAFAIYLYSLVCRIRSAPRLIGINTTIASLSSEIFVALSTLRTNKKSFGYIPLSDSHWGALGTLITARCGDFLARVFAVCRCFLHGAGGYGG